VLTATMRRRVSSYLHSSGPSQGTYYALSRVHSRPAPIRELPNPKPRVMYYAGVGVALLSAWTMFTLHAFNQERLASSVVRQIMDVLRCSDDGLLIENVGRRISMVPSRFFFNQPHIAGTINLLQGKVDISFQVQGSEGSGTVYFSSIRKAKGQPFTILRFKLICDNGEVVQLKGTNIHDA